MARKTDKLQHPDRKISDTLLQFAKPLLESLSQNSSEDDFRQTLQLAWMVWNTVVYADVAQEDKMLKMLMATIADETEFRILIASLIDRKRTLFADDHRLIGEFELHYQNGELRLRAEAGDPRT